MHPILHFIIPVSILLLLKVDRKLILFLSPLTIIYDADILTNYHRALFHNVFIGLSLCIIALAIFKKKKAFFISLFFYLSHIIMDFDKAGIGLLFPITDNAYCFDIASFAFITNKIGSIQFPSMPVKQIIANILLLAAAYAALFIYSRKDLVND